MKSTRKDMPTWNEIKHYWSTTSLFDIKHVQNQNANFCFACTRVFHDSDKLERSHIHALHAGGSNDIKNLHLLCPTCHKDSEDYGFGIESLGNSNDNYWTDFNQTIYWDWFFDRCPKHAEFSEYVRDRRLFAIEHKPNYSSIEFASLFYKTFRHNRHLISLVDFATKGQLNLLIDNNINAINLDAVAQLERAMITARMNAGRNAKKARGYKTTRIAPYGYTTDPSEPQKLIKDPFEQSVLADIRTLRESGLSLRDIAAELAQRGIMARNQRPFTAKVLNDQLKRNRQDKKSKNQPLMKVVVPHAQTEEMCGV
jgi:hypothetical protein